jgi:hypothetical protein
LCSQLVTEVFSEPKYLSSPHENNVTAARILSLFGWLVADGWCWFVLREEYCWLVAGGWFVVREKYCWLVADKPSEQGELLIAEKRVTPFA